MAGKLSGDLILPHINDTWRELLTDECDSSYYFNASNHVRLFSQAV